MTRDLVLRRFVRTSILVTAAIPVLAALPAVAPAAEKTSHLAPDPASNLELTAPIDRWDEAVPLGNGLLGGLLWGSGPHLKLSLDRGDLWDLRVPETLLGRDWNYATMQKLVAEKNQARMVELFDNPYSAVPYATKIPAGRLEITLDKSRSARSFHLDLSRAVARVDAGAGAVEVFYSTAQPVVMLRIAGPQPRWKIVPPDSLKRLGYPPAERGEEGPVTWTLQEAALGLKYAVVVAGKVAGPLVHDARIAALCRHHAVRELWSADRDFSRFSDLRVVNPVVGNRRRTRASYSAALTVAGNLKIGEAVSDAFVPMMNGTRFCCPWEMSA